MKPPPTEDTLSVRGWQHAGGLAAVFAGPGAGIVDLAVARPDVIFASGSGKRQAMIGGEAVKVGSRSRRPLQTVTMMAAALNLTPVTDHMKGEEHALVADALGRDGCVLICWQHQDIPAIGNLIVGDTTTVPQSWPEGRYDLIWVFRIELKPAGASVSCFTSACWEHELVSEPDRIDVQPAQTWRSCRGGERPQTPASRREGTPPAAGAGRNRPNPGQERECRAHRTGRRPRTRTLALCVHQAASPSIIDSAPLAYARRSSASSMSVQLMILFLASLLTIEVRMPGDAQFLTLATSRAKPAR